MSRTEHAYTTGTPGTATKTDTYGYRSSGWKDQLISYNGSTIDYDDMGNPKTWRGMNLTWERGSMLKSLTKDGKTFTYTYDAGGNRVQKEVDGVTTRYFYNGNKVVGMSITNASGDVEKIHFIYDSEGNLFAMQTVTGTYYYLHNLQNDIVGLIDSDGTQVVSYQYDSWGRPLDDGTTDNTSDQIGSRNPFRYREYFYDVETGFYYVSSRYYDPEIERFINADTTDVLVVKTDIYDKNLYAYCDNNPIVRKDSDGQFWDTALDIAFIVGDIASIIANPSDVLGYAELAADIVGLAIPGVSGGGKIVRLVVDSDNVLDAAKLADKVIDSKKVFNSTTEFGKKLHAMYNPIKRVISSVKDAIVNKAINNTRLRPDAVDFANRIIYELKPYNRRSFNRALRQTKRYANILGGSWKIVIDMYRR